ncbi:DUF6087 family protein [Streptomyces antarcticus]|uniref:DUF6087 family protein n=1 Tax=Streptomyces antarcticus TaxID=2996458 RepID=UPI00226F25AD|nr:MULTISPECIES: DUF6087 family protein [unclassified Streptomyces]MCY0940207.1 DUF6087 family protein [Streptomyces sp. H34-AA3]MCZ4080854.1 DUF6087 family protein [Streptomyces sp. H34-S5]
MTEEPFERWAARRQGRLRKPGELKAITLGAGPQRAAHVDPDAPRMILEWDGFAWQPVMPVENYAAARRVLNPPPENRPADQAEMTGPVMGPSAFFGNGGRMPISRGSPPRSGCASRR